MSGRYLVEFSHPRIVDGKMLASTYIKKWNNDTCFYYSIYDIDNMMLMTHILLKFSGDEKSVVYATAEMDAEYKEFNDLNLRHWSFS